MWRLKDRRALLVVQTRGHMVEQTSILLGHHASNAPTVIFILMYFTNTGGGAATNNVPMSLCICLCVKVHFHLSFLTVGHTYQEFWGRTCVQCCTTRIMLCDMPVEAGMSRRPMARMPFLVRTGRVGWMRAMTPGTKTADAVLPMPDGDGGTSTFGAGTCLFTPPS
jgi:hypothetical protein